MIMHKTIYRGLCWAAATFGTSAGAETIILDDFNKNPQTRWEYLSDVVMGGVSDGAVEFATDGETSFVRLTGTVSTESNGGFLQVRRLFSQGLPAESNGLDLNLRGNGETYFVFLRTRQMTRPWHFFYASFQSTPDWNQVRIPLDTFEASRDIFADPIDPQSVISLGFVAYGRDHSADLSVASVGLY